jgi:hypothetical protein
MMICDTCIIRTLSKPMSCKPDVNDYCAGYAKKETVMKTCDKCKGIGRAEWEGTPKLVTVDDRRVCPDCHGTGEQPEEEVIKPNEYVEPHKYRLSQNDVELIVDRCFHAYASSYRTEAVKMAAELLEELIRQENK